MPPHPTSTPTPPRVWKVAEITRHIRSLLESSLGPLIVEGEISGLRLPASGHAYFTLKDATCQLRAVMYRSALYASKTRPADGTLVRAHGRITLYDPRGEYQLLVSRIEPAGQGELAARLQALKQKLQAEGLFDPSRKRPLPTLPQYVGIVTSPTGAAIQDILNVINRRYPNLHLLLAPVRVQGEGAALEIAAAIHFLNALRPAPDVLIVGRGGGSLEDLWAFNEEPVVRAIARSHIPVISAVGHEIDCTLSDFAADLRAPTPSAAAEILVRTKNDLLSQISALQNRVLQTTRAALLLARNRLDRAAAVPPLRDPLRQIASRQQQIDYLALRLQHALSGLPALARQRTATASRRQSLALRTRLDHARRALNAAAALLRLLDPANVLARGYTLTRRAADGLLLRSPNDVPPHTPILTRFATGLLPSITTPCPTKEKGTTP